MRRERWVYWSEKVWAMADRASCSSSALNEEDTQLNRESQLHPLPGQRLRKRPSRSNGLCVDEPSLVLTPPR